ncbi:hypothetical protein KKE60_05125 [Patescibacteria group bacterium]|nr:hypothetical protein [Patescibacteria group bacterium]
MSSWSAHIPKQMMAEFFGPRTTVTISPTSIGITGPIKRIDVTCGADDTVTTIATIRMGKYGDVLAYREGVTDWQPGDMMTVRGGSA